MPPPIAVRFVLVRPVNALNIGAAARAMANFGLEDLVVVSPREPQWREAQSGIYASELLARAPMLTLNKALADCHLVIGTASAHNRTVRRTMVTLPAFWGWLKRRLPKGGKVAVLFGSEKNGLENAELDRCHALLRIPTVDDAPSMNLGQAVAVTAYEFLRAGLTSSVTEPPIDLVDHRQLEGLVDTTMAAMKKAGVNNYMTDETRRQKFRRGLLKWRLSPTDASWLRGLLARLTEMG